MDGHNLELKSKLKIVFLKMSAISLRTFSNSDKIQNLHRNIKKIRFNIVRKHLAVKLFLYRRYNVELKKK